MVTTTSPDAFRSSVATNPSEDPAAARRVELRFQVAVWDRSLRFGLLPDQASFVKVAFELFTLDGKLEPVDDDNERKLTEECHKRLDRIKERLAPSVKLSTPTRQPAFAYGPPSSVKSPFGSKVDRKTSEVRSTEEAEPSPSSVKTSQAGTVALVSEREAPVKPGFTEEPVTTTLQREPTPGLVTSDTEKTECKCLVCTYGPAEPVEETTTEHVPAAMSPVKQPTECKCLVCTYGPAEPFIAPISEHVPDAMSSTKPPPGCKPSATSRGTDDTGKVSKDQMTVPEANPSVMANNADPSRQDAPVKEKAQTKHRGRPPEDNADEPGPQPQDRPPDADRAVRRCRATQGIAKWGERCWVCVAHPLL